MKKIMIFLAAALSAAAMLVSCTGNTVTDGNTTEKPSSSMSDSATEPTTESNILDEAESALEDMSENATHGVNDGTPGGDSVRGGDSTLFPRGK